MPYASNADLPLSIRRALPEHAQDIYRAAFNRAWQAHGGATQVDEAIFHRIAWGAVKRVYERVDGRWRARAATGGDRRRSG